MPAEAAGALRRHLRGAGSDGVRLGASRFPPDLELRGLHALEHNDRLVAFTLAA